VRDPVGLCGKNSGMLEGEEEPMAQTMAQTMAQMSRGERVGAWETPTHHWATAQVVCATWKQSSGCGC
jgi:hypothetical protein